MSRPPLPETDESFLQYREGIVGFLVAGIVELVNFAAFNHSEAGTVLAVSMALIGLLLSITRFALQSYIRKTLLRVDKLAEVVDLSSRLKVPSVADLLQTYVSITEDELRPVKEQILAEASEKLRILATDKRSPTLQTADYYVWLFQELDRAGKGDYIHAVSLSSDEEWNDSQVERNFLAKNIAAAHEGAEVERIFVVEDSRLQKFLTLPPIVAHTREVKNGLVGYYVSKDQLKIVDPACLDAIGEGFLHFSGRVGLEDRFDPNGLARGQVTLRRAELDQMESIFQKLKNMSVVLSKSLTVSASSPPTTPPQAPSTTLSEPPALSG